MATAIEVWSQLNGSHITVHASTRCVCGQTYPGRAAVLRPKGDAFGLVEAELKRIGASPDFFLDLKEKDEWVSKKKKL